MLLSNQLKFLFVHIAKTGGTSVRAALKRSCWKDPYRIPSYLCDRISHLCGHRIAAKLPRHAAAVGAKEMITPAQFNALFKFTFVRNPWDRHVSAYHHFLRDQESLLDELRISSFDDFTEWLLVDGKSYLGRKHVLVAATRRSQAEHIMDVDGKMLVDFIGRYERLSDDFDKVCRRIQLDSVKIPHRRRSSRRRDYRPYYTDHSAELVGQAYHLDLTLLGYRFDPAPAREDLTDRSTDTVSSFDSIAAQKSPPDPSLEQPREDFLVAHDAERLSPTML